MAHKHLILVNNYSHRDILAENIQMILPFSNMRIYPDGFRLQTNGLTIECMIILNQFNIGRLRGVRCDSMSMLFKPEVDEFRIWAEMATRNRKKDFKIYDDSFIDNLMESVWLDGEN